jgi:RNA polymerase sigma-70 factor (ECF subfamily)
VALDRQVTFEQRVAGPSSDAHLVAAARNGDRAAFGQLYGRYGSMVHGILLARVRRCDVADLVHDVFLSALRRLGTLRDDGAFGGWLATIARNRAVDHLRASMDETPLPDDLAGEDPGRGEARFVLEAVRSLPEAYRETLILRLERGCPAEIAARTGLTPGSVRVNLHRGMSSSARSWVGAGTMNDDYLWDKKGEPDADVEKLERMLGSFRQAVPPPVFQAPPLPSRRTRGWLALAAAVGLVGFLAGWIASRPERPTVRVASLAGAPRIGSTSIAASGRLRTGQDLVTDAASRARIDMGLIGEVDVEPLSRVGLVKASPTEHRSTCGWARCTPHLGAASPLLRGHTLRHGRRPGMRLHADRGRGGRFPSERDPGWVAFQTRAGSRSYPKAPCASHVRGSVPDPYRADAPAACAGPGQARFPGGSFRARRVLTTAGKDDT